MAVRNTVSIMLASRTPPLFAISKFWMSCFNASFSKSVISLKITPGMLMLTSGLGARLEEVIVVVEAVVAVVVVVAVVAVSVVVGHRPLPGRQSGTSDCSGHGLPPKDFCRVTYIVRPPPRSHASVHVLSE